MKPAKYPYGSASGIVGFKIFFIGVEALFHKEDNKTYVINFRVTWCKPCVEELPDKQPRDSYKKMKVRAKEKGFTFPYLLDEGQKVFQQLGATRTPHVYLLNKTKEGNKVLYIGAIDDNYSDESAVGTTYVEDAVDAILAGKDIEVKTTKAIGCTIKVQQ